MGTYAVATRRDEVRIERVLPGPIERVWAYLTDSNLRGQWLASGPMELHVGGAVELHFKHSELSSVVEEIPKQYASMRDGHRLRGRVVRCEPPRVLSYTWGEEAGVDSEVTFELTPQNDDVLLIITHRRLATRDDMISVAGGWHTHLDILGDRLSGRTPPGFWARHEQVAAEYRQRL